MSSASPAVIEVTDATFPSAVLDESARRPVVVDFWAAWCQPCRLIGPVLERLASEAGGQFLLAKLDVDSNPQAATAFGIQGIPAVKAFRDGRVVDEFVGAIPEQAIRQFLDSVVPSQADRLAAEGAEAERAGHVEEAQRLFSSALAADPRHVKAALGLGRIAARSGDSEAARRLLEPLRPDPEAERLLAGLELAEWRSTPQRRAGSMGKAENAAAEGRFAEALDGFLAEVASGGPEREEARASMLKLFAVLGDDDALTQEYRRRLAAALY